MLVAMPGVVELEAEKKIVNNGGLSRKRVDVWGCRQPAANQSDEIVRRKFCSLDIRSSPQASRQPHKSCCHLFSKECKAGGSEDKQRS